MIITETITIFQQSIDTGPSKPDISGPSADPSLAAFRLSMLVSRGYQTCEPVIKDFKGSSKETQKSEYSNVRGEMSQSTPFCMIKAGYFELYVTKCGWAWMPQCSQRLAPQPQNNI